MKDANFYRPEVRSHSKEETVNYSTEELRERKALTDAIVANLQIINDDDNDLEMIDTQTCSIVGNLQAISDDENNLEELDTLTSTIAGNLKAIADDDTTDAEFRANQGGATVSIIDKLSVRRHRCAIVLGALAERCCLTFNRVRGRLLFAGDARVERSSNCCHKSLRGEAGRSAGRKQAQALLELNWKENHDVRNKHAYLMHWKNHAGGTGEAANAAGNGDTYSDSSRCGRGNLGRDLESPPDCRRRRGVRRVEG